MAGYQDFSFYYDLFNEDADYEKLAQFILEKFRQYTLPIPIVVDLGCGTGDLTLLLAKSGLDMIAVDLSEDMLSVLSEKMQETGEHGILLLQQPLQELDLYGTVGGAVSTFDTLNHIGPSAEFEKVIQKASLFMEKDGIFIFDMNTPYKHEKILENRVFEMEEEGVACRWENHYDEAKRKTTICLTITQEGEEPYFESFTEYSYEKEFILKTLKQNGFSLLELLDGESFTSLTPQSERYLFVAKRS